MVEAGVKGLIGLAENYYNSEDEGEDGASFHSNEAQEARQRSSTEVRPLPIQSQESGRERSSTTTTAFYSASTSPSTTASSSIVSKPIVPQGSLVQILDVPSGWIHLQSTYLDGAGARKVRSFGLRNLADTEVDVTVGSDLDNQILFWVSDEEKGESYAAVAISSRTNTLLSDQLLLLQRFVGIKQPGDGEVEPDCSRLVHHNRPPFLPPVSIEDRLTPSSAVASTFRWRRLYASYPSWIISATLARRLARPLNI